MLRASGAARAFASRTPATSLQGQIVWVAGGAGVIGTGLARGLLNSGATVIVNSRHAGRLQKLADDLDRPERLIALKASLMPGDAPTTVAMAMDMSANRIDHVVAHSAVRWWASDADESSTLLQRGGFFNSSPEEYAQNAAQLGALHFAAAHSLVPRLSDHGTYTFVTSDADTVNAAPSSWAQINAHSVMSLAAAMCSELNVVGSKVRAGELRLGRLIRINRPQSEREANPREVPLSHDIGQIVAGIVAQGEGGLVEARDMSEFDRLKQKFHQ